MPDLSRPEIIAALSALFGALIGSTVSLAITFINRRFDDRRHMRELAIKTAFSHWERHIEMVKLGAQSSGKTLYVLPLDNFIIHMLLLAELVSTQRITAENVVRELARIRRISDAAIDSTKP